MIAERHLRALLIEDSEDDAQLIRANLTAGGFSLVSRRVETAEELLQAIESEEWNVVLSDFNLPRFGAIEALELLRTMQMRAPMIVVTGAIGEESAAAVIKAGAADLVTKQGLHRLIPVIERTLREQESRRQYELAIAALNESEARFQAIAANLPGVVFQAILHADGTADFAYVSEGSQLVLGVSAEALMASPNILYELIVPEDRPGFIAGRIQSAVNLAPRNWEGRIQVAGTGGEVKWVNLRASVRKLSSGAVISDGIISNITESKLAQQAILRQQQQLRQLASHVEKVKEEERGNVAREIHDDLGGTLTAAKIDLAWIRSRLNPEQTALAEKADGMEALLDYAIASTGRISRSLRPLVLDHGVTAAIEWQVKEFRKRMGVACDFVSSQDEIALDPEYATALFRIFQEALTNIAKHADASRVEVTLEDSGDQVEITIADNGRGIANADMQKSGSYGIRGMRERAESLGGELSVSGSRGAGTLLNVRLPAKRPPVNPNRT